MINDDADADAEMATFINHKKRVESVSECVYLMSAAYNIFWTEKLLEEHRSSRSSSWKKE